MCLVVRSMMGNRGAKMVGEKQGGHHGDGYIRERRSISSRKVVQLEEARRLRGSEFDDRALQKWVEDSRQQVHADISLNCVWQCCAFVTRPSGEEHRGAGPRDILASASEDPSEKTDTRRIGAMHFLHDTSAIWLHKAAEIRSETRFLSGTTDTIQNQTCCIALYVVPLAPSDPMVDGALSQ